MKQIPVLFTLFFLTVLCSSCLMKSKKPHTKKTTYPCYRYSFDEVNLFFRDANKNPVNCPIFDSTFIRAQKATQDPCNYQDLKFNYHAETLVIRNLQNNREESIPVCIQSSFDNLGFSGNFPYCLSDYRDGKSKTFRNCNQL